MWAFGIDFIFSISGESFKMTSDERKLRSISYVNSRVHITFVAFLWVDKNKIQKRTEIWLNSIVNLRLSCFFIRSVRAPQSSIKFCFSICKIEQDYRKASDSFDLISVAKRSEQSKN